MVLVLYLQIKPAKLTKAAAPGGNVCQERSSHLYRNGVVPEYQHVMCMRWLLHLHSSKSKEWKYNAKYHVDLESLTDKVTEISFVGHCKRSTIILLSTFSLMTFWVIFNWLCDVLNIFFYVHGPKFEKDKRACVHVELTWQYP